MLGRPAVMLTVALAKSSSKSTHSTRAVDGGCSEQLHAKVKLALFNVPLASRDTDSPASQYAVRVLLPAIREGDQVNSSG